MLMRWSWWYKQHIDKSSKMQMSLPSAGLRDPHPCASATGEHTPSKTTDKYSFLTQKLRNASVNWGVAPWIYRIQYPLFEVRSPFVVLSYDYFNSSFPAFPLGAINLSKKNRWCAETRCFQQTPSTKKEIRKGKLTKQEVIVRERIKLSCFLHNALFMHNIRIQFL